MASKRDMEAARDAASFDDDRKEGRYAPGGDRGDWFATARDWRADVAPLEPEKMAAIRAAEAQIARAFSPEAHAKWLANQAAKAGRAAA